MTKLSPDQFASCRPNLNRLFEECVANLECRDRPIRVVYSLQTLCGLIKAVFRKQVSNISYGAYLGDNPGKTLLTTLGL